jgi:very-short-patch-repair endonuclease
VPPLPRVLTVDGADRLGFTAARRRTELRRGHWQRLTVGVLLTRPDEPTRDDWIQVGMVVGGPGAALSGWDAVRLRGLGPSRPPDPRVLVLTTTGHNRLIGGVRLRPSGRPLIASRISGADDTLADVRVAAPGRAVADTALLCTRLEPVRAMVTSAVQRGLCTPDDLIDEYRTAPRNHSAFLRRALLDVLAGARSIAEAEAIQLLHAIGLTGFEANAPIHDGTGRIIYVVDLCWPALQAIVEIDSREFHFGEEEWKATMRRHNVLTGLGFAVAHYPPSDIRRRKKAWAYEVADWLRARAVHLGLHSPLIKSS